MSLHHTLSSLALVGLKLEVWIILALVSTVLFPKWRKSLLGKWCARSALIALVGLTFLPIGEWLLYPTEKRLINPTDLSWYDGLIILGGSEDFQRSDDWVMPEYKSSAERVMHALSLAQQHPQLKIIISGGGARSDHNTHYTSETDITHSWMIAAGIRADRIIIEDRSRNTMENALFSLKAANPDDNTRWLLVTSAFHMPRAMAAFERAGWSEVSPYAVDHQSTQFPKGIGVDLPEHLRMANLLIKEAVGSLTYSILFQDRRPNIETEVASSLRGGGVT